MRMMNYIIMELKGIQVDILGAQAIILISMMNYFWKDIDEIYYHLHSLPSMQVGWI